MIKNNQKPVAPLVLPSAPEDGPFSTPTLTPGAVPLSLPELLWLDMSAPAVPKFPAVDDPVSPVVDDPLVSSRGNCPPATAVTTIAVVTAGCDSTPFEYWKCPSETCRELRNEIGVFPWNDHASEDRSS